MPPEVVIGAIGKITKVPRFGENDEIVKASMIKVVWSADHRLIDGATMTNFNNKWKALLENPFYMTFHLA